MKTLTLLLLFGLPATGAMAQALNDPMRPPMASAAVAAARDGAPAGAGLQTVLISGGRRLAVIDGREVGIGDRVRGAEVIEIRPSQVILKSGSVRQVLRLLPTALSKQVRTAQDRVTEPLRQARAEGEREIRQ